EYYYIGTQLPLDRFLTFYYAHPGFHINNIFIMFSMQLFMIGMMFIGALTITLEHDLCEYNPDMEAPLYPPGCYNLVPIFDWIKRSITSIFLVIFISFLSLFLQELTEKGLIRSILRLGRHFISLSPFFEVFTTQIYAYSILTNLSFGGARYIATGRGFATARIPFSVLYSLFTRSSIYLGMRILVILIFVSITMWLPHLIYFWVSAIALCISPFLFNPHQFSFIDFIIDYREFLRWMSRGNSKSHLNSWISYCRISRTMVTGYKKKKLGHSSSSSKKKSVVMTVGGGRIDATRPSFFVIFFSEIFSPFVIAVLCIIVFTFIKSFDSKEPGNPNNGPSPIIRVITIAIGPILLNAVMLLGFFILSIFFGSGISLFFEKFGSIIAAIVHTFAIVNLIGTFEILWYLESWRLSNAILENWAVKVILRKKSDVDYLKEAIKVKLSPSLDNVPISRIILKRHGEETELRPGLTIDKNFTTTTDTPIQVLVKESENGKINEILKTLKNQSENLENMVKNRNENLEKMSKELDERETKTISIVTELIDKLSLNVKVEPNEFSPRIFSGLIYKTLLVDDKKLSEKNSPFMLNLETSSGKFLKGKSDLYVLWDSSDSLRTAHTTSIFTPLHPLTDLKTCWFLKWIMFNDNNEAILNKAFKCSRYNSSIDNKIKLEKKFNNINDEGDSPFNFTSEYAEDYYNLFSSHGDENHHNGGGGNQVRKFKRNQLKDPNAPKRPNTAYILFSNEIRPETKDANPKANQKEIVTMIGQKWKALSSEQKKVYEDRYSADKERYDEELRAYRAGHHADSPVSITSNEDNGGSSSNSSNTFIPVQMMAQNHNVVGRVQIPTSVAPPSHSSNATTTTTTATTQFLDPQLYSMQDVLTNKKSGNTVSFENVQQQQEEANSSRKNTSRANKRTISGIRKDDNPDENVTEDGLSTKKTRSATAKGDDSLNDNDYNDEAITIVVQDDSSSNKKQRPKRGSGGNNVSSTNGSKSNTATQQVNTIAPSTTQITTRSTR
ncbi:4997_t:CDS:10, partial [Entrophospora sp. SA101]